MVDEYQIDASAPFKERLAQIRHDLKTPVSHIIGYSEMLEEEFDDSPWDEFTKDLKNILLSGARLVALIEDFIGPAKTNVDQIDFSNAQFQFRMQLNHVTGYCEMLRELAEDDNRDELIPDLDRIMQASLTFAQIVTEKLTSSALEDQIHNINTTLPVIPKVDPVLPLHKLGEGGDILIVDDNPVNLDLLSRRLSRQGYNTTVVDSGRKAMTLLKGESFDLILLDLLMPEMNGQEVLSLLKQDKVLRNIPVIILSALDDMEQIVNCVLLGADDYIFKPFNPVLLKARISASLEKFRLRKNQVPRLKVFISSPGDVIPERQITRKVISELNDELADRVNLIPIFWEDEPLLASDTFQAQIYPAKESAIYIGIFWSRLGSPLPDNIIREDGSRYLSGSEYEFEDAISGFKETGFPQLLVYKKTAEIKIPLLNREQVLDRLEQKEKVENFIENWFMTDDNQSYSGAFHCFENEDAFTQTIEKHLKKLVLNQLEALSK
jgi:CheY-like chemotaxis protein